MATKINQSEHSETIRVVFSPIQLATAQVESERQLAELKTLSIENDEDAKEANDYLRARVRELDAVELMLKDTLGPVRETEKRIKALFQPTINKYKEVVAILRAMLAGWEKKQCEQLRAARAEAAKIAQDRDPEALAVALEKAEDAAPQKLEGTSFVRTWRIARLADDLLPREYLCADTKKIEAFGRAHKGDDPPIIAGVIWVEDFSPRVKR